MRKKLFWIAVFLIGIYALWRLAGPAWMATWVALWVILNRLALVQTQQVELAELVKKAHEVQAKNQKLLQQTVERLRR